MDSHDDITRLSALTDEAMRSTPSRRDEIQDEIIASKHPVAIAFFARCVPGADTSRLQDAAIDAGRFYFHYASTVPGANISRLQDAALASGEIFEMVSFTRVPGADVPALIAKVVEEIDPDAVEFVAPHLV